MGEFEHRFGNVSDFCRLPVMDSSKPKRKNLSGQVLYTAIKPEIIISYGKGPLSKFWHIPSGSAQEFQ